VSAATLISGRLAWTAFSIDDRQERIAACAHGTQDLDFESLAQLRVSLPELGIPPQP
jgi:hypothetical protein